VTRGQPREEVLLGDDPEGSRGPAAFDLQSIDMARAKIGAPAIQQQQSLSARARAL
jgi:hypothetical protein